MSEKNLFLLRGIPGSGKTTLANIISDVTIEADSYFYVWEDPETGIVHRHYYDGEYRFQPELLPLAHKSCKEFCEDQMEWGIEKIAVSNTFTQEWEILPYFELAKKYGYRVYSLIVENRHGGKSVHDVPEDIMEKMKNRFEFKI